MQKGEIEEGSRPNSSWDGRDHPHSDPLLLSTGPFVPSLTPVGGRAGEIRCTACGSFFNGSLVASLGRIVLIFFSRRDRDVAPNAPRLGSTRVARSPVEDSAALVVEVGHMVFAAFYIYRILRTAQ